MADAVDASAWRELVKRAVALGDTAAAERSALRERARRALVHLRTSAQQTVAGGISSGASSTPRAALDSGIRALLLQIHPHLSFGEGACAHVVALLTTVSRALVEATERRTTAGLSSDELREAIDELMTGQLAELCKKEVSRMGVTPTFESRAVATVFSMDNEAGAPRALCLALEYLCAEVFELAGNRTNSTEVLVDDITMAIADDKELAAFFKAAATAPATKRKHTKVGASVAKKKNKKAASEGAASGGDTDDDNSSSAPKISAWGVSVTNVHEPRHRIPPESSVSVYSSKALALKHAHAYWQRYRCSNEDPEGMTFSDKSGSLVSSGGLLYDAQDEEGEAGVRIRLMRLVMDRPLEESQDVDQEDIAGMYRNGGASGGGSSSAPKSASAWGVSVTKQDDRFQLPESSVNVYSSKALALKHARTYWQRYLAQYKGYQGELSLSDNSGSVGVSSSGGLLYNAEEEEGGCIRIRLMTTLAMDRPLDESKDVDQDDIVAGMYM